MKPISCTINSRSTDFSRIIIENDQQIEQALKWYDMGADFADAVHLAVCNTSPLHTFDKNFCKAARNEGITPVVNILNDRI